MKIEKENLFKFLRRLSKELTNKFSEVKSDFEKNPPPNNEIKKRFLVLFWVYTGMAIKIWHFSDYDSKVNPGRGWENF